jgi:hypothetical protein
MKIDALDVLLPPIAATALWILGWSSTRAINRGRPLNPNQRMIAAFGFWFTLGTAYSMVAVGAFKLPHWASARSPLDTLGRAHSVAATRTFQLAQPQ